MTRAATDRDDVLLDLIGEAYSLLDLEAFRPGLLHALQRAVPAEAVSINVLGPEPGDAVALCEPPVRPELYPVYAKYARENPIAAHFLAAGVGTPTRMSDVVDRETFHATTIYRELYAVIGIEHQVAFTLPAAPGHHIGVALSRAQEDFTDGEVDFLARARPHLVQAYRNAVDHTRLKQHLALAPVLPEADLAAYGLTPREIAVVSRAAVGLRNADIASELGLGDRTVQTHLRRAYKKLGVSSRAEAARIAWRTYAKTA
jgi:DNA-binding CsgD family transcriptional regulator